MTLPRPSHRPGRLWRSGIVAALLAASTLAGNTVRAAAPEAEIAVIRSRAITTFKIGSDERRFGKLEFIGGIELTSPNLLFGAVSSIRFRADGRSFVAVLDTGHWVEGIAERDSKGKLSGLSDVRITSMMDAEGRSERVKSMMDAEGLALHQDFAIVSYERVGRVDVYPDPGFVQSGPVASLPLGFNRRELRGNAGLETVAVAPPGGPLGGGVVTIAELSLNAKGNIIGAVLDGPRKGVFGVKPKEPFSVTDGAFLPDGDLLILERRFSFGEGIGMQIRRIAADTIRPGAVLDGPVIVSADLGYQIDNMEGLDVLVQPDGEIRLIVVSDDNHSLLQRNLMLEFRLAD